MTTFITEKVNNKLNEITEHIDYSNMHRINYSESEEAAYDQGRRDALLEIKSLLLGETPIEQLNLSLRAYNCLKCAKINTISDLLSYDDEDLSRVRNISKEAINEINTKLNRYLNS